MYKRQFQAYQGPADPMLKSSELEGYQPVSRIGEIVVNAFGMSARKMQSPHAHVFTRFYLLHLRAVDGYEFDVLEAALNTEDMTGIGDSQKMVEFKPAFHEWATVLPGMICLSRKVRNQAFRNYVAAETAVPVISCCACQKHDSEKDFFFAGVARSKSVRPVDDGNGPSVDEYFTVAMCAHNPSHRTLCRFTARSNDLIKHVCAAEGWRLS